ncbi:MAG TPA: 4Fe-4S dicluster domain-containing protein [Fimbriimonadaceae bacterium]|nr:4Fe-4S dicluster domain-containing protein [Fimbriimonadaceae bacterium]
MQYGFVIDQDACIGCHACTVACKAENNVPVGGFRTSVKYVEVGKFPEVKRSFLVQRCNHCTNAPCVTICPVNALTKRSDGIVDVDRDACIGCRACMQACPYDAIYLNEDLNAVEKCHFCAHRIEKGLEPACVTVCPVGAIIPGDFDDPESRVSLIRKAKMLSARRPEQGTGPNVRYIGASEVALKPGSAAMESQFIWSQRRGTKPDPWPAEVATVADAREVLNSEHKIEWGWPVALYLVTKGIAGGAAMLAPFLGAQVPWWAPESIALLFTLVTVFLLIEDLKKPLHFYKLFTRPNWGSWLVKGGIVLTIFAALSAVILILGLLRSPKDSGEYQGFGTVTDLGHTTYVGVAWLVVHFRWLNGVLGALVAGYTAFLFKQCKGRDLWEENGLLWHLLAQSLAAGSAFMLLVGQANYVSAGGLAVGGLALTLLGIFAHEGKDATDNLRQARGFLEAARLGPFRVAKHVSLLVCAAGLLALPAATDYGDHFPWLRLIAAAAGGVALVVLFAYEKAFVRAGQLPPLS